MSSTEVNTNNGIPKAFTISDGDVLEKINMLSGRKWY